MKEEYVLKKITQLLDERKWTLYRLAKEADISYSTLSNTFQRNNVPSIPTLMRVCEGFGITMAEFFDEDGVAVKQLSVSDQKFIADYHRLPREDKRLVTAYMQGLLKMALTFYDDEDTHTMENSAGETNAQMDEAADEMQAAGTYEHNA